MRVLRRAVLALCTWAACAAIQCAPRALAKDLARVRVDFIDVGQGDAALITSPTGKTVLIDGGPHEAGPRLVAFLRARRTGPLDLILLTHRHVDHLGGLPAVVESVGARIFMDAPTPHPGREREHLMHALERAHVPIRTATPGRTIDLGGGATLTLLGPPEPEIVGSRSDVNANSVVARLDYGSVRFLFTGDAERVTERWLLHERHADVRARVLKVAHHGSRYSTSAELLDAVKPEIAVVSVGARNDYHHPAPSTLRRLEAHGARVLRTDVDGTVTIESDGRTITAPPARAPSLATAREADLR
jgi:beta-lactamase superfamily II metal-dependent hydrolase